MNRCKTCKGTGKITLFTSQENCPDCKAQFKKACVDWNSVSRSIAMCCRCRVPESMIQIINSVDGTIIKTIYPDRKEA